MQIFKSTLNTRPILKDSFKYIRSDVPTEISESEAKWLISNGITTIIDLRTDREREKKPCPLAFDSRFDYRSVTINGGDSVPASTDEVSKSYIRMVDENFNVLIEFLLNAKTGVLYFCAAGKDRTGVVSAVLLHKLGFGSEYIISDYMKTKDNLKEVFTEFSKQNPSVDINIVIPQKRYIEEFLNWYTENK